MVILTCVGGLEVLLDFLVGGIGWLLVLWREIGVRFVFLGTKWEVLR